MAKTVGLNTIYIRVFFSIRSCAPNFSFIETSNQVSGNSNKNKKIWPMDKRALKEIFCYLFFILLL